MGIRVDRVGLPGVQDKVSAAMLNVPVAAAGSQLLLKLNPAEFKHLVENEYFFLNAARRSRVRTVDAQLVHDADGVAGLAVTRFDRVVIDGRLASMAVEDGCQALGLHPADKYRVTTGSVVREAQAPYVKRGSRRRRTTWRRWRFAPTCLRTATHYAKNFSIIQDVNGRWQPTPAYDLPTSQAFTTTRRWPSPSTASARWQHLRRTLHRSGCSNRSVRTRCTSRHQRDRGLS